MAGEGHIDCVDSACRSALLHACEGGQVEVAKQLLDKKAKREVIRKRGEYDKTDRASALVVATKAGQLQVVSEARKQRSSMVVPVT